MKSMLLLTLLVTVNIFASTGWFQDYISLKKNTSTTTQYWIGGDPGSGTALQGTNLGSDVTALEIVAADMKYWSDTQDRTGGAFYWIIKNSAGTVTISGPTEVIWSHASLGGNDYQGTYSGTINVLAGLSSSTQYQLHIYAKSWGSNQGDSYLSNSSANYVATFTTDAAFPVELSSFTAITKGKGVELAWQTASETNNHGFEIEKKQSGSSWTTLGFKQGQGTTNAVSNYSYSDNSSVIGKVEYRLKQIDRDGQFTYSNVVEAVVGLSPSSVELSSNYPNPFNPSTSISFMLGTSGNASLKVYDVLGKEVAVIANGMFNAGEMNIFNFNASSLTSGVYYYRLTSGATVETRKMLLMK
jgi:hypothetical protein